jgi:DNA-binding NarL/FixJ family response regulator
MTAASDPPAVRRILLVDDHAVYRRGCREVLGVRFKDVAWVEAATLAEARAELKKGAFDLMILDLNLPGGSGLGVLKEAREKHSAMPVLVLTAFAEEEFGVAAIRLGAAGYLGKQSDPEELVLAVGRILSGSKYVSPSLAARCVGTLGGTKASVEPHETLSPRELQVLKWVASGKSLKEIAAELVISEHTVATYRARISEKLRLSTNVELTRYALKHGLVD